MIDFVRGGVAEVTENYAVIDVNGVGYRCNIPSTAASTLRVGQKDALLHTALIVTDGDMNLFGFLSPDERDLFRLLITVSGIGPKGALKVMCLPKQNLLNAIATEEVGILTTIPGIGKITAKRLILELKDKLGRWMKEEFTPPDLSADAGGEVEMAVRGLQSLGYSLSEVRTMLHRVDQKAFEGKKAEDIIRMCLKK